MLRLLGAGWRLAAGAWLRDADAFLATNVGLRERCDRCTLERQRGGTSLLPKLLLAAVILWRNGLTAFLGRERPVPRVWRRRLGDWNPERRRPSGFGAVCQSPLSDCAEHYHQKAFLLSFAGCICDFARMATVVVVGGGLAGLSAAIEAHRNGATVHLLEKTNMYVRPRITS